MSTMPNQLNQVKTEFVNIYPIPNLAKGKYLDRSQSLKVFNLWNFSMGEIDFLENKWIHLVVDTFIFMG